MAGQVNTPIPSDRGPGTLERDQAGEQKNAQKFLSNQKLIINFAATNRNKNQTTMAKYTATYKCGHEEQVTLFGPYSERDRKLERMANTLCPHCQREQNEQRTGITLEGSDKQANWAYDIMTRINALFDQLAAQINPDYLTQLEQVRADYNAHTSAKWWIDEADSTDTRAIALKIQEKLTK